jgi:hypothetical protein
VSVPASIPFPSTGLGLKGDMGMLSIIHGKQRIMLALDVLSELAFGSIGSFGGRGELNGRIGISISTNI